MVKTETESSFGSSNGGGSGVLSLDFFVFYFWQFYFSHSLSSVLVRSESNLEGIYSLCLFSLSVL